MSRKNKVLAMLVLLWSVSALSISCSTSTRTQAGPHTVTAEDGGQEEVLDDARDDFGRPTSSSAEGTAGGLLVSISYLGMMIGSAILPLLLLL
jgi:hypothetical protein